MSHGVIEIRPATPADVEEISTVVLRCLRETNAQHYSADIIATAAENFSPEKVAARLIDRVVLVAVAEGAIIGTASLHVSSVRSVFVRPDRQGLGIGTRLMKAIEDCAEGRAIDQLFVPSSVNAEGFYRRLGFAHLRDELHGQERVIVMVKSFPSTTEHG